jgi:hypothetical protein
MRRAGKTGRSSRDSMYCPGNCRALSSNNGRSSRSATRLTDVCSFAIISPEWSERSVRGSRDIDGQTREGERAGAKESMG